MSGSVLIQGCDLMVRAGAPVRESVDLLVEGQRLTRIEPHLASTPWAASRTLDSRGLLAVPGLINAHTHSPENPLRGLGEGQALEPWLALMFAGAGPYSAQDHHDCALAGAVEMLRHGATTVIDHLWMTPPSLDAIDATFQAYRQVGIRAAVAPLVDDTDTTPRLAAKLGISVDGDLFPRPRADQDAGELIAITAEAIRRWHGQENGRLRVLAGPSGVQWCSDELLSGLAELSRQAGTGLHMHLLETRLQEQTCRLRFDGSPVRGLDRLGVLGTATSLPHSVWLDAEDIELLAARECIPVHNPAANLRLGSGRAPVREMLDAGLRVALGTDGSASSDNQVVFDQIKLASLIHNDGERWISSAEALSMATAGGAAAFGLAEELGMLEPGRQADITLLDLRGDGLAGAACIEPSLALSENGRGVRHVLVAGEIVLENGVCTRVDEDGVRGALALQAERRRAYSGHVGAETKHAMRRLTELRQAVGPYVSIQTRGGTA